MGYYLGVDKVCLFETESDAKYLQFGYEATTINANFGTKMVIDVTANDVTLTLPLSTSGVVYVAKNSGTGTVTVVGTSGQLIDGGSEAVLENQYESITMIGTGSGWVII